MTLVFGDCIPNLSGTVYGGSDLDITRALVAWLLPSERYAASE
ncbi:hypothetical protein [Nostoc sp.]